MTVWNFFSSTRSSVDTLVRILTRCQLFIRVAMISPLIAFVPFVYTDLSEPFHFLPSDLIHRTRPAVSSFSYFSRWYSVSGSFLPQHTIIPRGSLSLKVLAELPIIVVLMYQVSASATGRLPLSTSFYSMTDNQQKGSKWCIPFRNCLELNSLIFGTGNRAAISIKYFDLIQPNEWGVKETECFF